MAAKAVMVEFPEIILAYGQSDEFSFVFKSTATVYQRRSSKLVSAVTSLFTSNYVFHWPTVMGSERTLKYPPSFDGRTVCYPSTQIVRDYLCWRQADCHINNLYNTCFWALVQREGKSEDVAEKELCGTFSSDKNELLFSRFQINYNSLPEMYRKGSVLYKKQVADENGRMRSNVVCEHCDIIGNDFWEENPKLLC